MDITLDSFFINRQFIKLSKNGLASLYARRKLGLADSGRIPIKLIPYFEYYKEQYLKMNTPPN